MLRIEVHMECSICYLYKYIWSAPYVTYRSTYGVLHTLLTEEHVEYFRYSFFMEFSQR
jgi:hypothetical protein